VFVSSSVELQLSHKYYALAAAFALLKYVEFVQNIIYAPKVRTEGHPLAPRGELGPPGMEFRGNVHPFVHPQG
jgi:hypothetical protein